MGRETCRCIVLLLTLVPSFTPAAGQAPGPRVLPILYLPADLPFDAARLQLQIQAVNDIQQWFATRRRGFTFFADPLVIQRSRHTFAELAGANFQNWWPLPDKEFADYGLPWNDSSRVKLLLLAQGAGAWAGADSENGGIALESDAARVTQGALGGLAVVGDSSLGGILAGVCPREGNASWMRPAGGTAWWCNWNTYRGTLAHELGHTFGLPHPDAFRAGFRCDSVTLTNMQCHWAWPADSLLTFEQAHLRSLDFFGLNAARAWTPAQPLPFDSLSTRAAAVHEVLWLLGRGGGTGYTHGLRTALAPDRETAVHWQPVSGAQAFVTDIGRTASSTQPVRYTLRCANAVLTGAILPADPPRTLTLTLDGPCRMTASFRSPSAAAIGVGHPRWILHPLPPASR